MMKNLGISSFMSNSEDMGHGDFFFSNICSLAVCFSKNIQDTCTYMSNHIYCILSCTAEPVVDGT